MRIVVGIALLGVLVTAEPALGSAAGPSPHTTARQAEQNVLAARHLLSRWRVGLTDPKTGLVRPNTTAQCTGRGRAVAGRYASFHCTVRHRSATVVFTYIALRGNGFELRHRVVAHR
jgi:hypothetical protein